MLMETLGQLDPYLVGAVLLAVLTLDNSPLIGAVVPSDPTILVAGATVAGPFEVALVAVAGVLGCCLGATGGWLIGRRYGSRVRHSRAGRWIGERRWARAERLVTGAGGGSALAAAYFLPVANSLTPILAGTLGMSYHRFIRWALAGSTLWVSAYLVLGSIAGEFVRHNEHLMVPVAGCVVIVIAGLVVISRRARANRSTEISEPAGSRTPQNASRPLQ
jgi:membrane-associated protein